MNRTADELLRFLIVFTDICHSADVARSSPGVRAVVREERDRAATSASNTMVLPSVAPADSGAHSPVETLTQKARMPIVAAVLQEHMHHHHSLLLVICGATAVSRETHRSLPTCLDPDGMGRSVHVLKKA